MKKIAVIGAGTMGNGIAHVFAQTDFSVTLIDINEAALERGMATITKNLDRQLNKERITEAEKQATLAKLRTSTDLSTAVADADLVVEAATENVDLKLKIFRQIDEAAPAHALHESGTYHEIDRGDPWLRHQ